MITNLNHRKKKEIEVIHTAAQDTDLNRHTITTTNNRTGIITMVITKADTKDEAVKVDTREKTLTQTITKDSKTVQV